MKTLISSALLFCILAAALWPVPEAEGATEPDCKKYPGKCPLAQNPVCGTDGRMYYNECALCVFMRDSKNKVKIQIKKMGKC
uniref:Proteinase inhibitor n=1 Tax=Cruziohyla calcarifer TaxID=318249 RepID=A0A1U9AKK2_CRUCA|nr:proteinase inhibitor precursor [Cruziohyla calcarifer]